MEFDPFTHVLVYSFPRQARNYPAIFTALPHITNNNQIIQEPEIPPPAAPTPAAPRGSGRPPGSKNKPKTETTGPTRDRRLRRTTQTIKSDTVLLVSDKNLFNTPPQVTTLVIHKLKSTGNAETISCVNILKSAQAINSHFFSNRTTPGRRVS